MKKKRSYHHVTSAHSVSSAQQRTKETGGTALIRHTLMGTGIALGLALLSLLLFSGICYATQDPHRFTVPVGIILLYGTAWISGLLSVRLHHGSPLPCGCISGLLIVLVFWFLFFLLDGESGLSLSFGLSLLLRALIPLASVLGALLGNKHASFSRKKHRTGSRSYIF